MNKTTYEVTVRGEPAITITRNGTEDEGRVEIKTARDAFETLRADVAIFLFDPPAIPFSEGFTTDISTLEVFDTAVRHWVYSYNVTQGEQVVALKVSGLLPKPMEYPDVERDGSEIP